VPVILAIVSCALLVLLSVFPPSSTRLLIWPWAGFTAIGWLLPIGLALHRFARSLPHARFGGLIDIGFALLVLTAIASAFTSPLRGVVVPHLLPFLGTCALPFAMLPLFESTDRERTHRILGGALAVILCASLLIWLQPWIRLALPASRNAEPFGHANITGSVAVLAATWMVAGFVRETARPPRILYALGAALAILTAISSGSRGAILALAAGAVTAGAILLLRRGRFLLFTVLAVLLAASAIATNTRLRELVVQGRWSPAARESNDQRITMIVGGLRLGAERPLLGWGAGSVPHVFPRVRADLPGTADNFLQLHNTPVQLWATLGAAGLCAALLIAAGLIRHLRPARWTPEHIALTAGLASAATVLLFDHPFATPAFAVLAAAHLAAWARPPASPPVAPVPRFATGIGVALLIPVLVFSFRDLAARQAYSRALDRAVINNRPGYETALRRALRLAPGDPYYAHLLAAHLATGHPFPGAQGTSPETAASLLADTLTRNPDLEYARYNLGWLLLASDPESAAVHFRESARLAPQRGAVYLGLGLARIRLNDTEGAVRALAAEWLLNPAIAWSPVWREAPLDAFTPRVRALATEAALARGRDPWTEKNLSVPAGIGAPYRRVRTGYGVLMGQPEGLPPVDFNIQIRVVLPPELRPHVPAFGWLDGGTLLGFLDSASP
jgi:O-antigen ligase